AFSSRLRAILEIEMPMDAETRELQPRVLELASDARELAAAFSDAVEQAQGAGGSLAHITGTASKIAEQACRIAGVLTLWQDINADEVKMAEMEYGVALAKFYLSDLYRLLTKMQMSTMVAIHSPLAQTFRQFLLRLMKTILMSMKSIWCLLVTSH
ncbi:YfjI family protein, partial [Planktomarina temperata]|nr:YfjI family protein [Planktomarina temperata]